MQTLYALEAAGDTVDVDKALQLLRNRLGQTVNLFSYIIYVITEVARYAETDANRRSSKLLPSQEDMSVNTRIAGNTLLEKILADEGFLEAVKGAGMAAQCDREAVRRLYEALVTTPEYTGYTALDSRQKADERSIISLIFDGLMLQDEAFEEHLEEVYPNWQDDGEMMLPMVRNFLQKPGTYNFRKLISEEKMEFALRLLRTAMEKKEYCLELISPRLRNWDADRIAQLDMIIMRLGLCELLYFETIPAKVSINEYIDLAKEYSTPQSGQFVNGILDSIHKDMVQQGKLHKVEYRR